jgi:NitT/TauT family transport system substrate-binding protein
MTSYSRTFVLAGAASALTAAAIGRATAQTTTPAPAKVSVGSLPIDISGTVYYALDTGLFRKHDLDVTIVPLASGAAIAPAVSSGSVDIGSSNFVSLAQAHERGIPFLMIAPAAVYSVKAPAAQLLIAKSSPFKTGKDLNGKTIAVTSLSNIAQLNVCAWVDRNGGDYKSLKFVEIPYVQMDASLAANRVDAVHIAEPFLSAALAQDAKVLAHDGDALGDLWVEGGYFATTDYVNRNRDIARRFLAAISEAGKWANANPEAADAILRRYSKAPPDKVQYPAIFPERFKPSDAQALIDAAAKYGALKASFPSAEMMSPDAHF